LSGSFLSEKPDRKEGNNMDYGIQNRVIGYDDSNVKVKRIKKFILPNGQEYDGTYEEYRAHLGRVGQANNLSTGAGEVKEIKE